MMIVPEDIIFMLKQTRKEMDNNRDIICSITEIMIVIMPIIPSSLWNRLWIMCLYILLYSVNAQDKYYEMKNKYLMAPPYEYDSLSDDDSHVDIRNDLSMGISAIGGNASDKGADASNEDADASDKGADASNEDADASDEDADASDEDADASEIEEDNDSDSDSDSDYEDNTETKKNK
jgi:hypothetical protein